LIKRTIEVSREPFGVHLAMRDQQLLVLRKTEPPRALPAYPDNLISSIPCEDIGVLMVDQRDTTYSHSALATLAEHGAALVICGPQHLPVGMYLPISTNSQLLSRLDAQLEASKPTCKRLWTAIVAAKVRAQADVLLLGNEQAACRDRMLALAKRVRAGDPTNIESQAAALYWPVVFTCCSAVQHPFRRRAGLGNEPHSPDDAQHAPANALLDYGYAVLRAMIARAIVNAGLLPALGIKHQGRSNPYCLADDLIEPLRPMIDRRVRSLLLRHELELAQHVKADLLSVLTEEVIAGDLRGPLMVAVVRYIASFIRVLEGEQQNLDIPTCLDGITPRHQRPSVEDDMP
jgi:CRISP-associated protein Cas1